MTCWLTWFNDVKSWDQPPRELGAWRSEEVHFPGSGKGLLLLLRLMSCREWWLLLLPDNTGQHSSCWQESTFTSPLLRLGLAGASQADSKVTTSNHASSIFSSYFCGSCSQKCFIVYVNMSIKRPVNNCDKNPTGKNKRHSKGVAAPSDAYCKHKYKQLKWNLQVDKYKWAIMCPWRMLLESVVDKIGQRYFGNKWQDLSRGTTFIQACMRKKQ